jgi:hypothetical protein
MVGGPAFRRKNAAHGVGVRGIGAQAVDRLRRKRDQQAIAQ